jgi:hypothetical protein
MAVGNGFRQSGRRKSRSRRRDPKVQRLRASSRGKSGRTRLPTVMAGQRFTRWDRMRPGSSSIAMTATCRPN